MKFFAIIQPDDTIKVIGTGPRGLGQPPIECLPIEQFAERSHACGIIWRDGRGDVLWTEADRYGAQIIATRLQLQ